MGLPLNNPARSAIVSIAALLFALLLFAPASAQDGDETELIEQGAQIFAENCAVCHGDDGQGRVGATLAKDWPSIRPDLRVRETIERGVSGTFMPAWGLSYGGPLSDQELDALTFYILSWQSGVPIYTYPTQTPRPRSVLTPAPGISGDPNRGAILYDSNCALCHGEEGEGRVGASLNKDWSSIRPDLRVKSVIENGIAGSVMPAWSQANGGPLPDQDISDITAYILTWSGTSTAPETQVPSIGPLTGWPVWVIFIGAFILIIVAIVYYSRQKSTED